MKNWLRANGFDNIFIDFDMTSGLKAGDDWERQLYLEITRCHALIVILTPDWLASKWCFAEFTQARALGKPIFPVSFSPVSDGYNLFNLQILDLTKDLEEGLKQLGNRLRDFAYGTQGLFRLPSDRPPYPGLFSFEEPDAAVFFGRDEEIRLLIESLNRLKTIGGKRLVSVVGASGTGKSSLVKAGVLPRLRRLCSRWVVLRGFRPALAPVESMALALAIELQQPAKSRELADALAGADGVNILLQTLSSIRVIHQAEDADLIIFMDQAEELFSLSDNTQANILFMLIDQLISSNSAVNFIVTLREDSATRFYSSLGLSNVTDQIILQPMNIDRLSLIIEGPAKVAGLIVENDFLASILRDTQTSDALPLLAFALRELYERSRQGAALTLEGYRQLADVGSELSPLEHIICKRAETALLSQTPDSTELLALREAFIAGLVQVDEAGNYGRRPADLAELPKESWPLIDMMVSARLLTKKQTGDGRTAVEIAHEALLRKWDRLTQWLDENREFLLWRKRLSAATSQWKESPTVLRKYYLLQPADVAFSKRFLRFNRNRLSKDEVKFIILSERKQRRRDRIISLMIFVPNMIPFTLVCIGVLNSIRGVKVEDDFFLAVLILVAWATISLLTSIFFMGYLIWQYAVKVRMKKIVRAKAGKLRANA